MRECQLNNWEKVFSVSQYQVLSGCGMNPGHKERARLRDALDKWQSAHVKFRGTFYDGIAYADNGFHILKWKQELKSKKITITMDSDWIEKIKQSEFFKYISFTQMKVLRSPLALRLYEILVKTFYRRTTWEIDALKLAAKIPMEKKYFSDIAPRIKAATKRISDKTELAVKVQVVKQGRGKGKFIFTKTAKEQPQQQDLFPPERPGQPVEIPQEIMEQIPDQWRGDAQGMTAEIFQKSGADELVECVQFVNRAIAGGSQLKKGYGAYLRSVYREGWHREAQAMKEAKEKAQVQAEQEKDRAALENMRTMPEAYLKVEADQGNRFAIQALKERQ
ncbi:MAG: replication initiation protein [Desulfobacteraceae bacterium]|nr:replication initiation protein [Desulfobacteraceae bacterium]